MPRKTQKELVELTFNGQPIKINRRWGGHRFTDSELKKLEDGEIIEIKQHSKDNDEDYYIQGKIEKQNFNGFTFWGFNRVIQQKEKVEGTFNGQNIKFNRVWGGHRFTDEEVAELLAGNQISITMESGTIVSGKLEQQSYNDHIFWGFNPSEDGNETEAEAVSTESEEVTIDEEPETEESANQSTESDDENFDMDF